MNSIVIVGRAVRDAEVRYSQGEKSTAFGNYTLAVDRQYKKDGEKEADFIMCKVVGKTAEFAEKYITKGVKMIVRGRMQIDNYTDKNGNKRQSAYIFVEQQEFAESKAASDNYVVSHPQQSVAPSAPSMPSPSAASADGFMNIPDGIDEELPFN